MKRKLFLFALLQICFWSTINATEVVKETHLYSVKGNDSLLLDRYYTQPTTEVEQKKPAILFMFGGAFYTGTRDQEYFISCFEYYARQGYEVFSIDYRLGLKTTQPKSVGKLAGFASLVDRVINLAVEDLYDATSFIVANEKRWNIDRDMIITFGSSAGAISILQAEYYRVNKHPLTKKLPDNFAYAGVISMAGAIFSINGNLKWNGEIAPMLLFQGDADRNVPYNKKKIFKYGFFGSKSIVKSLHKASSPYYFYTFDGAGHEIAGLPMNDNRDDINAFLTKLVKQKQTLNITKTLVDTSKPNVKKNFKMKDYLKANFTPNAN